MRALTATAVFTVTVLGAAALSAATSMSAATDGLTSDSLIAGSRVGDAFSGMRAPIPDDPDAPIKTGRWAEDAAPVELAGGPAATEVAVAPPEPIRLSRPAAQAPAGQAQLALLDIPSPRAASPALTVPLSRIALTTPVRAPDIVREPRIQLTISEQVPSAPGAGLDVTSSVFNEPVIALRPTRPVLDIKRFTLRVGPSQKVGKKGRWFVFAAGSGQAFGLNLMRDPLRGWKPAGWSVEQLAEFGKAQLGVGWRKDSRQIAASVARREISAYGMSREDTVFGISFTVSGKPPAKARREQRLPRAY
ncbi:MAG: hypothetical protein K9G59_10315 [Caulobacter sp.]|nr:hypothetical protein [Caulobacter sp.]